MPEDSLSKWQKITGFFSGPATKKGGGMGKVLATWSSKKNSGKKFVATNLEGEEGKALVAGPLKKYRYYFVASLRWIKLFLLFLQVQQMKKR